MTAHRFTTESPPETATFVSFLEGPAAAADGTVYFSDIRGNRIMLLRVDGHPRCAPRERRTCER